MKKILLVKQQFLLFIMIIGLFIMGTCNAAANDPDIIGTINFLESTNNTVGISFEYSGTNFYFMMPISKELLDMKQAVIT